MNPLSVNPTTGFLESVNPTTAQCLTSETKKLIIEAGYKYAEEGKMPNLYVILKGFGVPRQTFYDHLHWDEKFAAAWKDVKECAYDNLTEEIAIKAKSKMGVVANLAMLKFLERGRFSDDPIVINADVVQLKGLIPQSNHVIEGEIVGNQGIISTPKTNNEPDRLK